LVELLAATSFYDAAAAELEPHCDSQKGAATAQDGKSGG